MNFTSLNTRSSDFKSCASVGVSTRGWLHGSDSTKPRPQPSHQTLSSSVPLIRRRDKGHKNYKEPQLELIEDGRHRCIEDGDRVFGAALVLHSSGTTNATSRSSTKNADKLTGSGRIFRRGNLRP